MARKMVGTYGMSDRLGTVAFDAGHDEVFIGKSMRRRAVSEKTAAEIDEEISRIIGEAYGRCLAILEENRARLVTVAEYLLAHETMSAADFEAVFTDNAEKTE